jgi:hypothetical protein
MPKDQFCGTLMAHFGVKKGKNDITGQRRKLAILLIYMLL